MQEYTQEATTHFGIKPFTVISRVIKLKFKNQKFICD